MTSDWTFMSNYGHVLVCLARDPDARMRDIAEAVGVTERAVQQIVRELVAGRYVEKQKNGRRNRYRIVRTSSFRHPLETNITLGQFVDLATDRSQDG